MKPALPFIPSTESFPDVSAPEKLPTSEMSVSPGGFRPPESFKASFAPGIRQNETTPQRRSSRNKTAAQHPTDARQDRTCSLQKCKGWTAEGRLRREYAPASRNTGFRIADMPEQKVLNVRLSKNGRPLCPA